MLPIAGSRVINIDTECIIIDVIKYFEDHFASLTHENFIEVEGILVEQMTPSVRERIPFNHKKPFISLDLKFHQTLIYDLL